MEKTQASANAAVNTFGGVGAGLAAALSYHMYHGFWLAVGHFLLGWIYVFYHLFSYGLPLIKRY
jgi:hypothetical protein